LPRISASSSAIAGEAMPTQDRIAAAA